MTPEGAGVTSAGARRRTAAVTIALALGAAGLQLAHAPAARAAVSTTAWYDVVANNSGKCVDAASGATANGTAVQQYTCNGTAAQQWQFRTATDAGYVTVVNHNGSNPAWDVNGPSTASGAIIQLWSLGGWSSQEWLPVQESSGAYHFVNHYSGLCLDVPSASTADAVQLQQYTCNGTSAQSFSLDQVDGTVTTGLSGTPDFGPNVTVIDPSMSSSTIQTDVNNVYNAQQTNQFGTQRNALLFAPGAYNVDIPVGFNTEVAGLGLTPDAVSITGGGVHVDAKWAGGNATQNFWRDAENLSVTPSSGTTMWAVSQADPFRRMDVVGGMLLDDNSEGSSTNWSSGGYIGDSRVSGQINSGTQQQFLTQDTTMNGGWTGSNWNMVFVGDTNAPSTTFPSPPDTTVATSPTMREKPFLYIDNSGAWQVFVPAPRSGAQGADWAAGTPAGTSIPISQFYLVKAGDTAATINAALSAGKNLIITPGVYHLSSSINITRADTVVLGLGLATLVPDNGVTAITTADVNGVDLAGLLISAGTTNSASLVQLGPAGSSASHASDPTALQDVFFRVGGDVAGKATQSLVVNSSNVIGDDLWVWRADHGNGGTVGWTTNTAANGVVVNGANVTMYGLAVEHYQQTQVQWNGNGGQAYFYQSEMPYDVPNQSSWMNGSSNGYPSIAVAGSVSSFQAYGIGVYCYFSTNSAVSSANALTSPSVGGVGWHSLVTVSLGGVGTISHIINGVGNTVNSSTQVADLTSYP